MQFDCHLSLLPFCLPHYLLHATCNMPINLLLILLCTPAFLPPIPAQGCSVWQQRLIACVAHLDATHSLLVANTPAAVLRLLLPSEKSVSLDVCMLALLLLLSTHNAAITLMRN